MLIEGSGEVLQQASIVYCSVHGHMGTLSVRTATIHGVLGVYMVVEGSGEVVQQESMAYGVCTWS